MLSAEFEADMECRWQRLDNVADKLDAIAATLDRAWVLLGRVIISQGG